MADTYTNDNTIPGNFLLPGIVPSLLQNKTGGPITTGGNKGPTPYGPTALPQDSFSQYILVGPFMLGKAFLNGEINNISLNLLLGSFVNVSVLGYLVNLATGRENKMDPFGPIVVGVGQIMAGILIVKPLPAVNQ
jgi:hypothetical protein